MKFIIAAGGTGGHIYPGIAIAEEIQARNPQDEILFIGGRNGLEKGLIPREGYQIKYIHAKGIIRKISAAAFIAPFISFYGFAESLKILWLYKPNAVFLTGGYVSLPIGFAAKILGIKIIMLEQNVLPGIVTRIVSKISANTILSFKESLKYIKGIVIGNPVRKRITALAGDSRKNDSGDINVLIIGGSQGAKSINLLIAKALDEFIGKHLNIFHIIGNRDFNELMSKINLQKYPFYHPASYMYNIEECLRDADLIVSRAGATAIAEFLCLGIPSILIPFPYSAEKHQDINAETIAKNGAGIVLYENDLDKLPSLLIQTAQNKGLLIKLSKNAESIYNKNSAKEIVDLAYA